MSPAKITFSAKELEMVSDTGWILTKNSIIGKICSLFGELSNAYAARLSAYEWIDKEIILAASPKISKGEQYEGLPWVMLDHPRYYKKEETFAIRSFFWWGHGFSITLQLSGKYCEIYAAGINNYLDQHTQEARHWLIGIGEDPWQHHFREDNYVSFVEMEGSLHTHAFIKLTKRFAFSEWEKMEELMITAFAEILEMLKKN